jgi:hypothetical protein
MAVAHDVNTRFPLTDISGFDTTTGDRTFSHAGSASAKAAVVSIFVTGTTAPVTGVLYGGVAMSLIETATDTVEPGRIDIYVLLSPPTGTRTVTLQGCIAATKWVTCSTVTAATAAVAIAGNNHVNTTTSTNPTVTVTTDRESLLYGGVHGGAAAPTSYVSGTGYTTQHSADYGALSARSQRRTSPVASGGVVYNFTFGTSDDWCIAAVALGEVPDPPPQPWQPLWGRDFDGTGDTIDLAMGAARALATGARTYAAIVKLNAVKSQGIIQFSSAGNNPNHGLVISGGNVAIQSDAGGAEITTLPFAPTDGVSLVVATKVAGTAVPHGTVYEYQSQSLREATGGSNVTEPTESSDKIVLGGGGFGDLDGEIYLAAVFRRFMGVEERRLLIHQLRLWYELKPVAMWGLWQHQGSVPVRDLVGASHQTALTGTPTPIIGGPTQFDVSMPLAPPVRLPVVVVVGGTTFPISVGGTVSATGTLTKQAQVKKVGSLTAAGVLVRQTQRLFAGSSSASAVLLKRVQRALGGSSSASGTLSTTKVVLRSFGGTVTATGSLLRSLSRSFSGSASPTGVVQKQAQKGLAGSSTPSGTASMLRLTVRTFTGSTSPVGALVKRVDRSLTGQSTPVGALVRQVQRRFTGSSTASGVLATTKVLLRSFAGTVAAAGTLRLSVSHALGGSVAVAGSVSKNVLRQFTSSTLASGVLTRSRTVLRTFSGSLTISGAMTRRVDHLLVGSVSPTGTLTRRVNKLFAGTSAPAGVVTFFLAGAEALYLRVMAMARTRETVMMELRYKARSMLRRQL